MVVLWVILAVVVVAALVVGFVATRSRRGPRFDAPPRPGVDYPEPSPTSTDTLELPTADDTAVAPAEPALETPEPTAGRLQRLRARLARSQNALGRGLLSVLSREHLDEDAWEEIEEALLSADVGVKPTTEIVDALRTRTKVLGTRSQGELRALLAEELVNALQPDLDRTLHATPSSDRPAVVMVVGVNGTGKTTTCGKLARVLVADGRTVLLGAADTFRAAAAEQLQTWGSRVGAETVRGPEGGDPASVAFDAVKKGTEAKVDTVLIDTAGRLHTKVGLMDELGKVKRVIERQGPVDETLLVLDATTGQNGLTQARVFTEVVDVTGIVLTKLDGTARGGIVISVQRELGVPVKLVGLGEGADDLAPFEPEVFVDALLETDLVKALFKPAASPGFELVDRPEPEAGAGEVKIRVLRTGICGTDLHILEWDAWAASAVNAPLVPGHEFCGEVVDVGPGVRDVHVGALVSGEGHVVCGTCRNCRAGRRHLCIRTSGVGVNRDGAFAEYVVLPESNVWVHRDAESIQANPDLGAIFDPFGNAVHTALSFPLVGEDVLITGAGPIGLMAAAIARHVGARFVVITDVSPYRLDLARKMGVDLALDVSRETIASAQARLGMVEGFDVAMEMSGHPSALPDVIANLNHGGRIAMLGLPSAPIEIEWGKVVTHMITIKGIYGREMYESWYAMSAMLRSGLDISSVVTHRFPATSWLDAFATARSGQCGKVVLDWSVVT